MRKILKILWFPFKLIIWLTSLKDVFQVFSEEKGEVENASLPDVALKVVENPGGLKEHVVAFRNNLLRALLLFLIATGLALAYIHQILQFLAKPLPGGLESLVAIEVTEPIGTVFRVALFTGFAASFPYLMYQLWLFVAPAIIERRNRFLSFLIIPMATLLFIMGISFTFYMLLPVALPYLLNFMGINTTPRPANYISFTTGLMFWIGLFFEFPLVVFFLAWMGWIKPKILTQQWRIAVVAIGVIAAIITPTVDPINMSLVMGPMLLLYLLGILLAKLAERMRKKPELESLQP